MHNNLVASSLSPRQVANQLYQSALKVAYALPSHVLDAGWHASQSFAYVEALTVHLTAILVLTIASPPRQMDKRLQEFTDTAFEKTPVLLLLLHCNTKAINLADEWYFYAVVCV